MAYLAAGHSNARAARFGRVSRRTVYRWFKDDADFCAVYNAWPRELTGETGDPFARIARPPASLTQATAEPSAEMTLSGNRRVS